MRPQREHVDSNGLGEPAACPTDERLMPVFGNERVANAVPPIEKGSESNLRALFLFQARKKAGNESDQPSGVKPSTTSKRPACSFVLVPGMFLKSTMMESITLGSRMLFNMKSRSLRGSPFK